MSYRTYAQNGVNFDFEVKFDLEGQCQSPTKTIGILTKVFYTFGPNLAILAWTGPELSRGQASDWRTDWHTQTQAMTIPEGQNWPRVKMTNVTISYSIKVYRAMTNALSHAIKRVQQFCNLKMSCSEKPTKTVWRQNMKSVELTLPYMSSGVT